MFTLRFDLINHREFSACSCCDEQEFQDDLFFFISGTERVSEQFDDIN